MKTLSTLAACVLLATPAFAAGPDFKADAEGAITVTVTGTLHTGRVAIGGETTGTTITAKGVTWELDLSGKPEFEAAAEKLDGQQVIVQGSLEHREGVEIPDRWIVTVTALKAAGKEGSE